jgi:TonB-linked SusC/RagA family outer membrane protein
MKKKFDLWVHSNPTLKKLIMELKIAILFIVVGVSNVLATPTYSQVAKVSLDMKNRSLEQVMDEIESQSEFYFIFNQKQIDVNRVIDIQAENKLITDILPELFKGTNVNYVVFDRKILLTTDPLENNLLAIASRTEPQQNRITGIVTEKNGTPMPGVNVVVTGTTQGTLTDIAGKFSIEVPPGTKSLTFSFTGMETQEISIGTSTQINVTMSESIVGLEEVVVIGYGTQKKGDVTSSVATVKSDNFIKGSVTDAGQLIQGKVAGLNIIFPTGDPTSRTQILLRGNTSLMGQNQNPLILIDGIPGDMKTVAPQDVESIDVLKDGSAAAIYGTRGTNGVILITTKKAGGNKSTVEYSTYISTQTITRKPNLSSAADFRAQIASGDRAVVSGGVTTYPMLDNGASTDWIKEISQKPLIYNHNLTFRNGNEKTNYLVNLNYNYDEGLFKKSYNKGFSGHIDFNHSMFDDKVKININLFNSSAEWWGFNYSTYYQALNQNPTSPVKNPDGTWFQELLKFSYQSPVSNIYESDGKYNNQVGRYKGAITYTPLTGLKLSGVFSYAKSIMSKGYSETKQNASTLRDNLNGYANIEGNENIDRLAELTAEYSKKINKHNFMILGGYSYQDNDFSNYYMENWDFPTDVFGYNNIDLGQAVVNGAVSNPVQSSRQATNLIGFFGRLTYDYSDKYLLMASIRREEASQLYGTKEPWGTFPAVSVGWRITKESFMSSQSLFNDIKLRAGYGVTGSQPSDLFKGVSLLGYQVDGVTGYIFTNGKWIKTLVPTQNANPNLKWEEKRETDVGLDFSMLNDRIGGSFDYYNRQIHNLLWLFDVPSPPNLYNRTLANVGVMENKGVEVLLNIVPIKSKDFQWNTTVSYSTNKNKLVSLSSDVYKLSTDYLQVGSIFPPIQTFSHVLKVGGPVGNFYGYKVIDIGNDPTDAANYGQWVYEGADGNPVKYSDFKHSFEDKKVIGNGLPKFYLGWNNNFRYKNLDLSITQRGAFGFQVANLTRMMFENPRMIQYNVLTTAFDKVFGKTQLKSIPEFNSYYIENGDFWKIDNITLGYNFNKTGIKFIQSARLYASVLNAFIITGYKGIDPEVSLRNPNSTVQSGVVQVVTSGLDPGMDSPNNYPTTRTFTVGLNVIF